MEFVNRTAAERLLHTYNGTQMPSAEQKRRSAAQRDPWLEIEALLEGTEQERRLVAALDAAYTARHQAAIEVEKLERQLAAIGADRAAPWQDIMASKVSTPRLGW